MKVIARPITPADAENFTKWVFDTHDNLFDPNIMSYPTCQTAAIDKDGEAILYIPYQLVFMYESIAKKPGLKPRELAIGLKRFHDDLDKVSQFFGIRENYFICKDESVVELAKHHGYEEIKYKVLRRKIDPTQ